MGAFYNYTKTSSYGTRKDPFTGKTKTHSGNDYALPANTKVQSNVTGTVVQSSPASATGGYGNMVVVKDGSGRMHYYAHLNQNSVGVGDRVTVGDTLGLSGSTGRSTGPHLHYEVRNSSGQTLDPNQFVGGKSSSSSSSSKTSSSKTSSSKTSSFKSSSSSGAISSSWENVPDVWDVSGATNPMESGFIEDTKSKIKEIIFNILKFIIIALLVVLFVVLIMRGMDIDII